MAKVHKIDGEKVTADRIATALIERLILAEKRLDQMQKQIEENFDSYAETLPHLSNDGKLVFRHVLKDAGESTDEATCLVGPLTIQTGPA